jgi:DNA-3-methyladenine glycosylase I
MSEQIRCPWCLKDELYRDYHDHEWGIPVYDDRDLFEKLILDGFQAGLSWYIILKKRPHFQVAFDQFDPSRMARWDERRIQELMQNRNIVRNQQKIRGAVRNAQAYLDLMAEGRRFSTFLWDVVGGTPVVNHPQSMAEVPTSTPASVQMSKALKQRGFVFVGPTICYAFMQAVGMVDDHLISCWRK